MSSKSRLYRVVVVVVLITLVWFAHPLPTGYYLWKADRQMRNGSVSVRTAAIDTLEIVVWKSMRGGDADTAFEALEDVIFIEFRNGRQAQQLRPSFWLRVARIALAAEEFWRAADAAQQYLDLVDESDGQYLEVVELLEEAFKGRREQIIADEGKWIEAYAGLRRRLLVERVEFEGAFADALASGGRGPEMVVIPAGTLVPPGACRIGDEEAPPVEIESPIAVSRHEVTFAEWDMCASAGGCGGYWPEDRGWGRGDRPVIDVSWRDARAYTAWLSSETGNAYRLLKDVEWEYAARAGTKTRFPWGDDHHRNLSNCKNDWCDDQWRHTAPVASFPANAFGLYDMHGNVQEMVEYTCGDPDIEAQRMKCNVGASAGQSWNDMAGGIFAGSKRCDDWRTHYRGFRVARTLGRQISPA